MTQHFQIHPENPQKRLIRQVVEALQKGAVIAYPTDSVYALGCQIGNVQAQERIRQIRQLNQHHNFTLMCRDLADLAIYAHADSGQFRLLKAYTPGPYTFILEATKEVPRLLSHPNRKTIGLRIPENTVALALLEELNQPFLSVSLIMPETVIPLADPNEIYAQLKNKIDILVDGSFGHLEPTTVVDLTAVEPQVIRKGRGDPTPFIHILR